MQNYKVTKWFSTSNNTLPKHIGLYEATVVKSSKIKIDQKIQLLYWDGHGWKKPINKCISKNNEAQRVSHWRGVIADNAYPFEQIFAPPEPPELLNGGSIIHHSQWEFFQEDFGLAATEKLVLAEAIDYTEELLEFIKQFDVADDIRCDLNELLNCLENENSNLGPRESDATGKEQYNQARIIDEKEFNDAVRIAVDGFSELIDLVEDNLPMPDEEDDYDAATLFVFRQVNFGLNNIKKMIQIILEG